MMFGGTGAFFVLQAFQSPAKNGYMKELMGVRYLSKGSGILMIVTFSALMLAGAAIAFALRVDAVLPVLYALGGLQFVAFLFSLRLPPIGAYDATLKFPWDRYWNFAFARRKSRHSGQ